MECREALAGAPLEWIVTDPAAFGLSTATPVQRAILRAVDGQPLEELADDESVREVFGGKLPPEGVRPREVVLLGAIRTGKSLFTASAAVRWSQLAKLSKTRATDVPRVNVVSLDKDKAQVVMNDHLLGVLQGDTVVSALYDGESPEGIYLLHPTGRRIEVCVVAGKRAGGSLVARWSAGTIFDEAPRMLGGEDGHVVNLEDARKAALGRVLDDTQIWYVGSPYTPYGPVFDLYSKHWGNPTADIVVIKARGPLLNPLHWTEERCEEVRRQDPDTYRTDVQGEFLTTDEALFSHIALQACTRSEPLELPRQEHAKYVAGMDPGTRGNAWTLVIAAQLDGVRRVVLAKQWIGTSTAPLSPAVVMHDIATLCHSYGIRSVWSDQYSVDAIRDLAAQSGLNVAQCTWKEQEKTQHYMALRARIVEGQVDLPPLPTLLSDLRRVNRKATAGGVRIVLPQTGDGRHCDFAPSVLLALSHLSPEPEVSPEKKDDPAVVRMRKEADARWKRERWSV